MILPIGLLLRWIEKVGVLSRPEVARGLNLSGGAILSDVMLLGRPLPYDSLALAADLLIAVHDSYSHLVGAWSIEESWSVEHFLRNLPVPFRRVMVADMGRLLRNAIAFPARSQHSEKPAYAIYLAQPYAYWFGMVLVPRPQESFFRAVEGLLWTRRIAFIEQIPPPDAKPLLWFEPGFAPTIEDWIASLGVSVFMIFLDSLSLTPLGLSFLGTTYRLAPDGHLVQPCDEVPGEEGSAGAGDCT